ncbi:MAG: type II secretion system F family protein [Candidatus Nitrosocaldaceae archaeon]
MSQSSFDIFISISLRIFRNVSSNISKRMKLRDTILSSYMNITPESLVSFALFMTLLTSPLSIIGVYLFLQYQSLLFLVLIAIPPLVFIMIITYPKSSVSNRKAAIEDELPFMIGYASILAAGGIALPFALERISDNKLLPASAREARHIFIHIKLFGKDPISALEDISKYNPNHSFTDFIGGYVITLKSGGDTLNYLLMKLKDAYHYRALRLKSLIDFTGNLAEAYMGLVVVLGIVLLVIFTSQGLISGNSSLNLSDDSIMQSTLFSTVVIPVISAAFIGILHTNQPREPISFYKPYKYFMIFLPSLLLMFFFNDIISILPIEQISITISDNILILLSYIEDIDIIFKDNIIEFANYIRIIKYALLSIPLHIRIIIGLIISVLPASIIDIKYSVSKRSVESRLAHFLRDLAEVSKNSISIEKALQQLVGRNYGKLTEYVNTLASQLSWGFPIEKIIERLKTNSWFVRVNIFILLEIVTTGGKPEAVNTLAEFAERVSQLDKEKSSSLRLYSLIPYIGAIISTITFLVMLDVFTAPIEGFNNTLRMSEENKSILLTGVIIQSFTTGIVAGKMGEGRVSAGFKHALILTIISLICIVISPFITSLFNI